MARYRVPFTYIPAQFSRNREQILAAVEKVLSEGQVILRQEVQEFEQGFAEFVGARHAVGVGSGYDSLYLSLRAIELDPGDEVITVSHTCMATVGAIVNAGGKPILVDVRDDCNMDPDLFEAAISPRTRAVIPVHLDGAPCEMDRILAIAEAHGLTVIEDVAQAAGATFDGRRLGTMGIAGGFSLYPFKMIGAYGDAGMITTNDDGFAAKLRALRNYGVDRETGDYVAYGANSRLDNLHAAILLQLLPQLPQWVERRREIASVYFERLGGLDGLILPTPPDDRYKPVFLNYILRTTNNDRDAIRSHLAEQGVETLISLSRPIHTHPALGLQHFSLPKTEEIARSYLCLPINPEMTDEQVEIAVSAVRSYFD